MPNGHGKMGGSQARDIDQGARDRLDKLERKVLTEKDVRRIVREELRLAFSMGRRHDVSPSTDSRSSADE